MTEGGTPATDRGTAAAFDAGALRWAAARLDPAMALDRGWAVPDWDVGRQAITGLLGIDRSEHFLNQPPGVFPRLPEPQVTRALAVLLTRPPDRSMERTQALFDALTGPSGPRIGSIQRISADDETRMDLAVRVVDRDGVRRCLVIEAKFDHELTGTQLARYRKRLTEEYPRRAQRHLFVVATRRTGRTTEVLNRATNAEWRFLTWRRLLVEWQRAMPDEPGRDVAGLFGEIWKRAGGR